MRVSIEFKNLNLPNESGKNKFLISLDSKIQTFS